MRVVADRASAEDLVQDTLLSAMACHDRFVTGRRLMPWLIGILANHARMGRRRSRRRPDPDRLQPAAPPTPAEALMAAELTVAVDEAIARMPDAYREVLRMHLHEGRSAREISTELRRSPGTVRCQLHRGLSRLRTVLPAVYSATAGRRTGGA